jgi:putative membrane protein
MRQFTLGAAITLALTSTAFAQSAPAAAPADPAAPMATPDFVTAAGQSDQFEIQEGKMAEKMGSTASVRKFGAKMVRDHTKTTAALQKAVKKAGMTPPPPPALRPDQEQMATQLQGMSGADFDKAYLTQQVQSHQEALALMSTYAKTGDTPAIKAAAKSAVPIVQMHLKMAQKMSAM